MDNKTMIGAGAPPPPSEVKVRTMHSDLASMAKSGGGAPRFENVAVDGLSVEKEYATPTHAPNIATHAPATVTSSAVTIDNGLPKKDIYPMLIVVVVALLAIGGVGYFAYITFFAAPATQPSNTTPAATAPLPSTATTTATSTAAPTTTSAAPISAELTSTHSSLFRKPADQTITITLTSDASIYRKTMLNSLSSASPASSMIEINPKANDGANLNISGLLSSAGASALNNQALADFDPDATFFVYRDKNGLWPGYVLALNAGESSSSAEASVKIMEQSSSLGNLFLSVPGTPSSDGFTDSSIASLPVRVLPFTGITAPAYFVYGWDKNYLILSTSQNGFAAAVANLE